MNNVIHESFSHGKNFNIGHFCVIEEGVRVGDNVTIGNYVLLKAETMIGNNTFVDSYVRSSGHNVIGDNCTIRFGATIAREVFIKNNVFISPNVMTIYSKHSGEKSNGIFIGDNSFIGTAAIIGPNVNIVKNVIIGALSYVLKSCNVEGIYVGIPAELKKGN